MLCEQVLGKLHDFDTTGKTIEYVDINAKHSRKYIKKQQTKEQKWESHGRFHSRQRSVSG